MEATEKPPEEQRFKLQLRGRRGSCRGRYIEAMRSMRESYKHKSSSKLKPSLKRMN
jgi:hypothetical protein